MVEKVLTGITALRSATVGAASSSATVVKPNKTADESASAASAQSRAASPARRGGGIAAAAGKWALYLALPVIVVVVWAIVGARSSSYAMATPQQIVQATVEYAGNGELWLNIAVSIARVLEGFLVAFVAAAVLGVAAGVSRRFERFIDLVMQVLRPIPGIAWIPLAILWFGIGENSKVYIIFIGAFFPMFVNFVDGIKGIDKRYFELGRVYEIPKWRFIRQVVVPAALPQMLTGIRLGLSGAWICVVAAEMIGATSGVGFMLSDGRSMSRPDVVILAMLIIGIVGKLMDDVVEWQRRRIVNWL